MNIREICELSPVIPAITIGDAADAAPLAGALIKGGILALEVTLRTPAALDAIREMAGIEGGVVGAGTLITPADVVAAKEAGARFGVSPGFTPALLDAARDAEMPLLPGVNTPTEMMALMERGFEVMKFFPAGPAGGPGFLKAISGPLPKARFCPTGGISLANAGDYLSLPNVLCVGGSWVAPGDLVARGDWEGIERLASEAASLLARR